MKPFTYGRCAVGRKCPDAGVIFRFEAPLKGAVCPSCRLPLKRTTPGTSTAEIREVHRHSVVAGAHLSLICHVYGLSVDEAHALDQHPYHVRIQELVGEFSAGHGVARSSALARGYLLDLLRGREVIR